MKKLNKFFAVLVALAMMATLCVSMAFATTDGEVLDPTTDTDKTSTSAKLVKYLVVPEGIDVPTVTNTFTFTADASAGSNATEKEMQDAAPATQTIVIDSSSTDSNDPNDASSKVKAVDLNLVNLEEIKHPGVYAYTVEEATPTVTTGNGNIKKGGEKYTVRYTVVNDGNGGYTIKYITVTKYDEATKKNVTVTDPTGDKQPDGSIVENDGGFSFKNTYQKTEGGDTYDEAALKIKKTVTGKTDDNTTFPVTVKLTKAVGAEDTVLKAQVYDVSTKEPAADSTLVDVPYGDTGKTFNITTGQAIVFLKMPVGTKYTTSEDLDNAAAYSAYKPSVVVNYVEGTEATDDTPAVPAKSEFAGEAELGQHLDGQAANTKLLIEENDKDLVEYTNAYDSKIDTPTGILISNLPYIALALVAIGGLVAYVVVRRRQSDEA